MERVKNNKHGHVKSRASFLPTYVWRTEPAIGLQEIYLFSPLLPESGSQRKDRGILFVRVKQEATRRKGE